MKEKVNQDVCTNLDFNQKIVNIDLDRKIIVNIVLDRKIIVNIDLDRKKMVKVVIGKLEGRKLNIMRYSFYFIIQM